MSLNKGKHIVKEVGGVLCTLVETGINAERVRFLSDLLTFNHFEVKVEEVAGAEGQPSTFTLGVTDLVFNPVISVFGMFLKRTNGERVSPAYWNQEPEVDQLPYFDYRKKNPEAVNEDDFLTNPWAYRTV
jgi:hypothetical protein